MSAARTARRRRKQMAMNNAQWSGPGVPRYGRIRSAAARLERIKRAQEKAAREGRSYGFQG